MKKTVLDIHDLQELLPFLKGRFGTKLGNWLLKITQINKVNEVHARNCDSTGSDFTTRLLKDPLIDLKYVIHNKEILDTLPEGAFVTVSNHPIGSLDGIILIDIFAKKRPDFKVMVNGILSHIGAMEENFISVEPTKKGNMENINGVRLSLQQLKEGHPMGFFPAGSVSFFNWKYRQPRDLTWVHSIIRLIRKSKVTVYPVFFDFYNTFFFYILGRISWKIRTLFLPAQAFNKRGRIVNIYLGNPISPEEIAKYPDDTALANFLYECTYNIKKQKKQDSSD